MLVSLWLWAAQNATDGDLSGCSDRGIAEAAEYRRKPETFVAALMETGWLNADRKLHDWDEYATLLMDCEERQREQTRSRVQKHRERKKAQKSGTCNAGGNVTDTPCNAPTVPNRTLPNITLPNTSGDGGDNRAREASRSELELIGLKPGEFPCVTAEKVEYIIRLTRRLFDKYRPDVLPQRLDCRMVFTLAVAPESEGLLDYAFEKATLARKTGDWRYIGGIMRRMSHRGITTAEEAREWDDDRPDLEGEG